ncbi:Ulp1 protease family, C-terminal catalytic domain [Sesbania bispinosa]|nr:Ulp1 protease family, C-terminal catalytic domain [Sesbania bispinosa]
MYQIYVPIQEYGGHWFLMVISLEERHVYYLDYYVDTEHINGRLERISAVCGVLSTMMASHYYPPIYDPNKIDFQNWEVITPKGITNTPQYGDNSAVWVLHWMRRGTDFKNQNWQELNGGVVRMRVAMDLVLGDHNELKEVVIDKVTTFWHNTIHQIFQVCSKSK